MRIGTRRAKHNSCVPVSDAPYICQRESVTYALKTISGQYIASVFGFKMGATVSRCLGIVPYAPVVASESSEVSVEELERMMRDVAQELADDSVEHSGIHKDDYHDV